MPDGDDKMPDTALGPIHPLDRAAAELERRAREFDAASLTVVAPGTPDAPEHMAEVPPVDAYLKSAQLPMPDEEDSPKVGGGKPKGHLINLRELSEQEIPPFHWFVPGWLSPHATLLSGKGGVGKSLASLQMAVALAAGRQFLGAAVPPLHVLLWSCEEDIHEMHRRLARICDYYEIRMADLADTLFIDCRHGLDNTLMTQEFGRPMWTPLAGYMREQVNDLRADVMIGDNLAHMYACSENDRHPVTVFASWLSGLVTDRPFCPLLIGHVAKIGGSEYSGSTAWENAVRMRWYLGDKLPEEEAKVQDKEETPGNLRFLCKRKTNYDSKDYIRFTMSGDGLLIPEDVGAESGLMAQARARRARDVVLRGVAKLGEMGMIASESPSQNYLPRLLAKFQLAEDLSTRETAAAMASLMVDGRLKREVVGRDKAWRKREGLVAV